MFTWTCFYYDLNRPILLVHGRDNHSNSKAQFQCRIKTYRKPVLSGHSKIDKTKILKTNGSLMKVESIAECFPWSILQYFRPALSDNYTPRKLCLWWVYCFHVVYTPANFVCGGYTVFMLSVRASVCASVRLSVRP